MEETYNTIAIITNNEPYREHDSKITAYTVDRGKLELVARGTKKIKSKLAGHLEPASLVNLMVVRGKQYDYTGFADSRDLYANIKDDFDKILICGQVFREFNKLIKTGESDEAVFGLLKYFLDVLNNLKDASAENNLLYNFFIFKLLSLLGYAPELRSCAACASKISAGNQIKFSASQGGLLCGFCRDKNNQALTISDNCVKILRIVLEADFSQLIKIKIDQKLAKEIGIVIEDYKIYQNL